jgi:hypothetical protein
LLGVSAEAGIGLAYYFSCGDDIFRCGADNLSGTDLRLLRLDWDGPST